MDLTKILNIEEKDYEETIKNVINQTKEEYKGLGTNQTCMLFSSIIYEKLKENHILARIVSTTEDLQISFEHRFVLAKDADEIYLIDLTYEQFFQEIPKQFRKLHENGYQIVDEKILEDYLKTIFGNQKELDVNIDDLFFKRIKGKNK